jgi:hypothetical protein
MSRESSLSLRWLAGGLAALGLTVAAQAQVIDRGALLVAGDDVLVQNVALSFSFPYTDGAGVAQSTTAISVSTNGWCKLTGTPASTSSQLGESVSLFLGDEARIAAHWDDLDDTGTGYSGGGVYFNDTGSVVAITWDMYEFGDATNPVLVQVQLRPSGQIDILHLLGNDDCLIGVSAGNDGALTPNPAPDPGPTDLSALVGTNNLGITFYELFASAGSCDLQDTGINAPVSMMGGFDVTVTSSVTGFASAVARGVGCPSPGGPGSIHERFGATPWFDLNGNSILYTYNPATQGYTATPTSSLVWETNYSNALNALDPTLWALGDGDDGVSVPLSLGFTATYWDTVVSQVELNPNGRIYLEPGGDTLIRTFTSGLAQGPMNICGFSTDLDATELDPVTAQPRGLIYYDQLPAGTPTKCVFTWIGVPRWSSAGGSTEFVDMQIQLFANGDVITSWVANNLTRSGTTGFFAGGASAAPPDTDFSTQLGNSIVVDLPTGQTPMELACDAPTLGSTPTATATNLDPGTLGTVMHVGIDQTSTDLTFIGMPGCTAYTLTLAVILPMTAGVSNDATASLGTIPSLPSVVGTLLSLQAISFVPGANALNLYASNGVDITAGY